MNSYFLVLSEEGEPAMNMAIDEALLFSFIDKPLLRLYYWDRPSITIGYFQSYAEMDYPGCSIIRRATGGGVVDHRKSFTFTLFFPREHPFYKMDRYSTYEIIDKAILLALESYGLEVHLHPIDIPDDINRKTMRCYSQPAKFDIVDLRGNKICGGAQKKSKQGFIHQGYIDLSNYEINYDQLFENKIKNVLEKELLLGKPSEKTYSKDQTIIGPLFEKYGSKKWNEKR